jgi:hypothetical protein
MAIYFWCAKDHVRGVRVEDLLALPNPPRTTEDALKRAVCRDCEGKALEFRISWAGKHTLRNF